MSRLSRIVCDGCGKVMWEESKTKYGPHVHQETSYRVGKIIWYSKECFPNQPPRKSSGGSRDVGNGPAFLVSVEDVIGHFDGLDTTYDGFDLVFCLDCGYNLFKTIKRVARKMAEKRGKTR